MTMVGLNLIFCTQDPIFIIGPPVVKIPFLYIGNENFIYNTPIPYAYCAHCIYNEIKRPTITKPIGPYRLPGMSDIRLDTDMLRIMQNEGVIIT